MLLHRFLYALPSESLSTEEYERQLTNIGGIILQQPLAPKIYDNEYFASASDGANWVIYRNMIEELPPSVQFPIRVATSGNSVTSEFNPVPAHPRLKTYNDENLEILNRKYNELFASDEYNFYSFPRHVHNNTIRYVSFLLE